MMSMRSLSFKSRLLIPFLLTLCAVLLSRFGSVVRVGGCCGVGICCSGCQVLGGCSGVVWLRKMFALVLLLPLYRL